MKRRQFLGMSLGVGLTAFGLPRVAEAAALSGRILGVSTLNPSDTAQQLSEIVSLNLGTGRVDYHSLPSHKLGHSLVPLPDGGFYAVPYGDDTAACLMLNHKFEVTGQIKAPTGFGFGGHAVLLPDKKHLFGHFNQTSYGGKISPDQTGKLYLVNIDTKQLVSVKDTSIIHGHDIILSRDGTQVIVGDDGTIESRLPEDMVKDDNADPFALVTETPSLAIFDAKTAEHQKTIPLDVNGCFVHIEQDREGQVFGAVEQYVAKTKRGLSALRELLGGDRALERFLAGVDEEVFFDELPYPGPLMRVDLESNSIKSHLAPLNQAPFDVKMNAKTGQIFNIFTASNMLARHDPLTKNWQYFSVKPYNIDQPYGLTDIPGTAYMAVNGFFEGIAIFDTITMSLVSHFPTKNFGVKHLLYQPLI